MIPLAAVASVPITFGIFAVIRYAANANPKLKRWPPNYWW